MMCLIAYYSIITVWVIVVAWQAVYAELGEETEVDVSDDLKSLAAYAV